MSSRSCPISGCQENDSKIGKLRVFIWKHSGQVININGLWIYYWKIPDIMAKLNKLKGQNQYFQTYKTPKLIHQLNIDHFPLPFTLGEQITKLQGSAGLVPSKAAHLNIPNNFCFNNFNQKSIPGVVLVHGLLLAVFGAWTSPRWSWLSGKSWNQPT